MDEGQEFAGEAAMLTPEDLGLDDKAADFVQKLHPEKMQEILQKVHADSSIRSPSAMVTKMAKEAFAEQELAAKWLSPEHFDLDDRSSDFLRQLPPDHMQEILEKLQANIDTIRSPSAFVTKMAKEARDALQWQQPRVPSRDAFHWQQQGWPQHDAWGNGAKGKGGAPPWTPKIGPPAWSAESLSPEQLGLDEGAADFLSKLPWQPRQEILQRLQNEWQNIRSPSAFATKLAKEAMDNMGISGGALTPEQFGLDERCSDFLRQLHPQEQQQVLQKLQAEWNSVRSPSALVTRMVKEILNGGSAHSPPMPDVERARTPPWKSARPMRPRAASAQPALPVDPDLQHSPPGLEALELVPEDMGLDAEAADFLRKLPPERMQDILLKLQAESDSIRSPSAFATKMAKQVQAEIGWTPVASRKSELPGREMMDDLGLAPELSPEQFDLDTDAADFLGKLPPAVMQDILMTLQTESGKKTIRSPSAFVTRLAKEALRGSSAPSRGKGMFNKPMLSPQQFGLDEGATDYVQQLPMDEMQEVLEKLQADWDTVRSPSAFVTRMVKERMSSAGKGLGKAPLQSPRQSGIRRPLALTPEMFHLDEQAADFLRKLQPHEMQDILTKLKDELGTVRSPSAFVTRLAKQTLSAGMEGRSSRYAPY